MDHVIRGLPAVAAALIAVAGLGLGMPAGAGASVNGQVVYTTATAGYQVHGASAFNDVRATVAFPFITGATSQASLLLRHGPGAGPAAELSFVCNGGRSNEWTLMWGYSATSAPPASLSQPAAALPRGARQAAFSRVGICQLLSPANPSSPTRRLTLGAVSLDTLKATVTGKPPASANPLTLVPYPLGAGSAFQVVAVD
jgi:hypothetical protein